MGKHPLNSMKGIFNRNQNENSPNKKKSIKRKQRKKNLNQIGTKQTPSDNEYQREFSELDKVYSQHIHKIENEIKALISDVQYLDSKNPVVSSQMKKIMVELITNLWVIGNTVRTYKEENQLTVVSQQLSKYEKIYLKQMEDPDVNPNIINEFNNIKRCQKIINESLHPINSTLEYYEILMSKLYNWGFEVKNPKGQKYDIHMDMNILAFEKSDPNLEVPTITETKKPEIYLNGNKLAKAHVIVTRAGKKSEKTINK